MTTVLPPQKEAPAETYTFASRPRAIHSRSKYRESAAEQNDGPASYGNIMYDRRVIRGNTYALHTLPATAPLDPAETQRQLEARRRAVARKRAKDQQRAAAPEPVEGRKHADIQTDLYLEELSDRIEESNAGCQTDAFLDRPATPLFIPAKTGKDVATQIEDGELFDFDLEVHPLLEVLVGKTMEQALLEVMEEEELASLRAQQRAFEALRDAELVEAQRLEERERRRREEKERRIREQREVLQKENELAEKVAARAFAQQHLAELLPSVYTVLQQQGFFYDPTQRDVETGFLPWLMEEVSSALERRCAARTVLDMLIKDVTTQRVEAFHQGADLSPDSK
ncbi:radial spoke head protein 3 homolog [Brienomyrus brachyistius]|uniref:radial spoke head protein 3 homolog n=1 Tax=Brienomyrus brachyistius TaxID=42636 RepID=UPI0020B32ED1|nr:radial spoke head protein 3 homolog [Brienomyrus brachyistius]